MFIHKGGCKLKTGEPPQNAPAISVVNQEIKAFFLAELKQGVLKQARDMEGDSATDIPQLRKTLWEKVLKDFFCLN